MTDPIPPDLLAQYDQMRSAAEEMLDRLVGGYPGIAVEHGPERAVAGIVLALVSQQPASTIAGLAAFAIQRLAGGDA